jgi:hypothetical protein
MSRILFLAWQDPIGRRWHAIGRLTSQGGKYKFAYTGGVKGALETGRFEAIPSFPDIHTVYEADELFPLFSNRVLPQSRPEYHDMLKWLSVPETEYDPVAILARTGGRRVTDAFEVFPCPEPLEGGTYQLHFLVHGLSHMPPEAVVRAEKLKPGEPLLVMKDIQNPQDKLALLLRTAEQYPGDMYLVGYCPRYLREDFLTLIDEGSLPVVSVVRVNLAPAPVQFRVLCRVEMRWPKGFEPFAGYDYQPLVGSTTVQEIHQHG